MWDPGFVKDSQYNCLVGITECWIRVWFFGRIQFLDMQIDINYRFNLTGIYCRSMYNNSYTTPETCVYPRWVASDFLWIWYSKQDQVSVNGFLICQVIAGYVFSILFASCLRPVTSIFLLVWDWTALLLSTMLFPVCSSKRWISRREKYRVQAWSRLQQLPLLLL